MYYISFTFIGITLNANNLKYPMFCLSNEPQVIVFSVLKGFLNDMIIQLIKIKHCNFYCNIIFNEQIP